MRLGRDVVQATLEQRTGGCWAECVRCCGCRDEKQNYIECMSVAGRAMSSSGHLVFCLLLRVLNEFLDTVHPD